ncbi:ZIP family metal transporter [Synechococcus sp. MIT S1220]|uniref:ZIP family metal transporter n=1 Tax=Synechococcus sp. MIT S1220 TaxID=3082549 RepID=UPI0039B004EC
MPDCTGWMLGFGVIGVTERDELQFCASALLTMQKHKRGAPVAGSGTVGDAAFWSFVAMVPVLVSAWVGMKFTPSRRVSAFFLALSAGMLIALLSYDLVAESFRIAGIWPTMVGFVSGLLAYIGANHLVAQGGGIKRRHNANCGGIGDLTPEQQQERNTAMALVIGAALDGIPESMSIGISFLENPLVSASVILAVAVANIPEGLASGAGLKRSGVTGQRILVVWASVVIVCVLSSVLAYSAMAEAPAAVKGLVTAFAGGGVMAMTFQAVIPEAYEEVKDWISILGGSGFAVAFLVSHIVHH